MIISRIFKREKPLQSTGQIIGWWEIRRILFNLLVGLTGILNCVLMFVILFCDTTAKLRPAPGPVLFALPLYLIIIFIYGIMANVCYTFGWITEIIVVKTWKEKVSRFGEILFALGLVFSIVITLIPAGFCLGRVIFADNGYILDRPEEKDIVGIYYLKESSGKYASNQKVEFRPDGTFEATNIPDSMEISFNSGSGRWELTKDFTWWRIKLHYESNYGTDVSLCQDKDHYKIEITIGDPDEGNYLYFVKKDKW